MYAYKFSLKTCQGFLLQTRKRCHSKTHIEKSLQNTKDKTSDLSKINLSCKICGDCKKCYTGQTESYLETRLKEESDDVKLSNLHSTNQVMKLINGTTQLTST